MKFLFSLLIYFLLLACSAPKGDVGPQGPAGVPGKDGIAGTNGPQGAKGETGDVGPTGDTGAQGSKGATGSLNAYYSGWKELAWQLQSEQTNNGLLTSTYTATFTENTINSNVLEKGFLTIFFRKNNPISNDISILYPKVAQKVAFSDNSNNYTIMLNSPQTSKLSFTINVTSQNETSQNILNKINNERIAIQSYAVTGQ